MTPSRGGDDERRALVRRLLEQRGIARNGAATIGRRAAGPVPLSYPQQRLWFLHQLDPRTSAYNLTAALALTGDLDAAALRRALNDVVARHDALRMGFATVAGEAAIALHDRITADLPVVEISADEVQRRLLAQAHEPFDLARPPLFRAQLLRIGPREHVLAITAHHIVFDGWSIAVFVKELAALYAAATSRTAPSLSSPPIGYADFAAWQRARHAGGSFDGDLAYWTTQLANLPLLDLPTDRPRPTVSTFAGASRTFTLAPDLVSRVTTVARSNNATPFMALTAALAVVLGRFSGQEDVAVGSPIAGRSAPELEGLIGLFANTLVLRTDLSGKPTFRELLDRVRGMTIDAYAHQEVPFEYLVERLRPERRLSAQPLFQVALAMQHEGIGALSLPGLDVRVIDVASNASKFDLTIALTEERGGISGSAEFSTDLFEVATIERLLDSYRTLLEAAVSNPDAPIDRLALLSAAQRSAVIDVWDSPQAPAVKTDRLHEGFERQAERRPNAIAVTGDGVALTYRDLNARANQLARHLVRRGVRVEDRIGLYLDRTPQTLVAILAVLKAGAAYVPVDPVNPGERVGLILEDAGVRMLLSDTALRSRLPSLSMPVLLLDEIVRDVNAESTTNLDIGGPPDALAYVIYTSGSTGRPKGVLIQHDHVQRLFSATDAWFGFNDRDVWTLFHSYGFDFSVWEIWGALLYGGRLVVVPYLISRSPDDFRALIARDGVTVLNQTPSAFAQLVDADARSTDRLALRFVIFGGEALDLETLRPWFARHGDTTPQLVNMYGITETTVHVTYRPILHADLDARSGSVIGVPIPDLRVLVVDRHLEPVPFGVAGELCVGGAGVARGYLDRPDLTAEKFVPDPLAVGGRLYRSGDLARLSASGDLTYLGRIDDQVKIRGFRIEVGEIESALTAHPDVGDAAVLAQADNDSHGDRRLIAYVAPRGGASLTTAALREHLGSRLPDYMIPAAFVVLDRLPLTPHGKVDRRALPQVAVEPINATTVYEAPVSSSEQILAAVWAEVLRLDRVGRHDNFFELGGDSIRSIRVLALARQRGVAVSLQELFQHQTIAGIVAALGEAGPISRDSDAIEPLALLDEIDRVAIRATFGDTVADAYPLTRLQEGMLFHGAFDEASTIYHNVSSFHLRMAFDGDALESAVTRLIDRHPILRTSLHPAGFSRPLQIVHRAIAAPLTVHDWRDMTAADRRRRLDAWFADERAGRFEWTEAPLFRLQVHRLTDEELQITLTEHHAVLDGWSVAALLSELMTEYLGAIGVAPPVAPTAPSARFADHVARELAALSSSDTIDFWSARLAETVAPALPALAAAPRSNGVITAEIGVPEPVVAALDALARSANVPLRTTLFAAHAKVVSLLLGQADLVTGLVVNTRPESADGERALGLFLNTVPLRVHLDGGTWRQLCAALFAEERALLPHRAYPLAELQRAHGGAPLFRTAFNYVHFHVYDAVAKLHGLELIGQRGAASTDLPLAASFSRDVVTGAVRLSLECADTGIDEASLSRIASYYLHTLTAIASGPDARYDGFSPLQTDEANRVRDWSRGARIAAGPPAPLRVVAHALSRPDATAIVAGDLRITFADLNAHAEVIAQRLREKHIGPESLVALISAATPDLIAGMLGVWKAGAAFVPIDPDDPEARIAFMLEDAAPAAVLRDDDLRIAPAAINSAIGPPHSHESDPDAPAYVIYTSGSTGRPKGVVATHRGLANLLDAQIPRFGLTGDSRVLQFAALGFDASISEIFTTLAAGGTLVLAARADLRLPDRLHELLREHAITTVTLPPTMLAVLETDRLPALTTIVSAGEACRADLVLRWSRGRRLLNAYGPTETTVCAAMSAALQLDEAIDRRAPIGTPLENLDSWILDRALMPVPTGVAGELFVGGASLARGYLRRPDLTAERFIPHPFADAPGARLYRTGDLARWRDDGQLEYVGRTDSQIKIRGVRVELGEIEAVLQRHADVAQAAVIVDEEADGQTRLIAYVEHRGRPPSADELRQHLGSVLSSRVVPASIVVLDRLPLTPSGKLDRRALPAPARPALDVTFSAPTGPIETVLAEVWAGVLRLDRVGVDDNFFSLGGDSILSLQVVARARACGIHITPQQVFEHQTIAALARVAASSPTAAALRASSGDTVLSPIQRWFFELDVPSRAHWNQALLLEVAGTVDRAALRAACALVFAEHDAFRQRFERDGDGWRQTTAAQHRPIELESIDVATLSDADRIARVREDSDRAQHSLDLTHGPLAAVVHYDAGPDVPGRLLLVGHHLIVDGVSWRILLDDLQSAYEQSRLGHSPALPAATMAFEAWTESMSSAGTLERFGAAAKFWRTQAQANAPAFESLSTSDPRNTEAHAATVETWLDAGATHALLQIVPHTAGAHPQEAMLTAAVQALAADAQSARIRVAVESHGRDRALNLSRTIGWFTAMYPVALQVSARDAADVALRRIRQQLRAVPDSGLSYGWLRYYAKDASVRDALASAPDVSFNYLGRLDAAIASDSPFSPTDDALGPMRDPSALRPHLLDIVASIQGGRLRIAWLYASQLISKETVEAIATGTVARLRAIVEGCEQIPEKAAVEDSYALTPMQHGMLFHALYAPASGVYVQQVAARLRGTLDAAAFHDAWQAVVDRHPVLRTAFDWQQVSDPGQIVYRRASLPWTQDDWSHASEDAQTQRLDRLLAEDRARGFDLARPPLMRVALIRLAADRWQLVWTHHHLILDGWSVPLLLRDLFDAYRARLNRVDPVFEPRTEFREHVAWIDAQDPEIARAFWTDVLADLERPRSIASSSLTGGDAIAGAMRHAVRSVSEIDTAALSAFARRHELTLNTVVQAAWALTVAAHSNTGTAVYGVTVGGRPAAIAGSDRMVGLCINTLPVRVEIRADVPVLAWLRDLQQHLARLRDFEHTPLVDALGCSELGRRPGALESLFVFENYPIDATVAHSVPGLTIESADAHEQTDFALTVVAVPGRELLLKIDADATKFGHHDVERLLAAFHDLLTRIPNAANGALGAVTRADASEQPDQIRRAWPDERLVHELIDAQAETSPWVAALVDGSRTMTFAELRAATDAVAAMLRGKGVSPDEAVGVALPRSIELIVALIGVLKAGAAYVPLDPSQPAARLQTLIESAGLRIVIRPEDRWPAHTGAPLALVSPDGLAYVLFTSGSTGTPKGVMVTHRGLANYVRWACEAYDAGSGNGSLLHSPIGFDLTVTSVFPLLVSGRPVRVIAEQAGLDGLAEALTSTTDYSLIKITPAHLDALRELSPDLRGAARTFVIGGEALTHEQLAHWRRHAPGTRLINEYGPTETVVGCAIYDATGDLDRNGAVPIGRPIANTRLYVLDAALNRVPDGVTGELYIAGDGIARGYHRRPDLTAAAFIPDPFTNSPGARMYRSGDLARVNQSGALEFLGRADEQLKIRGYRIEPAEVEAALLSSADVREAAVLATATNGSRDPQLVAFVTLSSPASHPPDLRGYLRERLPAYLVPAVITIVERLPLTRNGKIDRAALAQLAITAGTQDEKREPPRGAAEELIAAIWSDVLAVDPIGRHDNFFDLGGHSLLATRVVARVRQAFGDQVALRDVFEAPTVADLAARVQRHRAGPAPSPIETRADHEPAMLSFAQQRMWVLDQLDPSSAAYLVPAALRIEGVLDGDALRRALAAVVQRHEVLRTSIRSIDGVPVAEIATAVTTPFAIIDLSNRTAAAQHTAVMDAMAADARTPFDLSQPPLMRVSLLRLAPNEHVMLLTLHHLISDARSTELLVDEIASGYAAAIHGSSASLPALRVQYADIARWQRQRLSDERLDEAIGVMRERLAGVPVLELPADRPRPQLPSTHGASMTVTLPTQAANALVTRAREEHATPFMAFLAAFEILLARTSGQRDFAVGTPVSGRDRPETEPLIGLFMNTLVLRSDVRAQTSFVDLLRAVRATTLEAQSLQELPFERLVDALQPERTARHTPLFQVMFTLQHAPAALQIAGLRVTPVPATTVASKFDVSLSVNQTADGWMATFEYRTDLLDAITIEEMATRYATIVTEAARRPDRDVLQLPWMSAAERAAAIAIGNDTARTDVDDVLVPAAIARQSGITPDAVALIAGDDTVTFGELRERVSRRSGELRRDGVGPESLVPLAQERSIEMIVEMLAILDAGGGYVPIDPAAPAERKQAMLARLNGSQPSSGSALAESIAYVIFTSGSTGEPKGVAVPHRALANHMRWMQRVFPLAPGDRVLQKTPAVFDASVWEFFAPLMAGATLVVAPPGAHQDPDLLIDLVRRHEITALQLVPSMLRLMVDADRFETCVSLRRLFAGGEALTADLRDRFFEASSAELINLYGPTEVTIDSVVSVSDRRDGGATVPIGYPIDNTTAYVLDDQLEPVPNRVPGELFLGGRSVARGYLGEPALTAERFLPDPFSSDSGAVLYRTGDRVRRRRDGALEYLGRGDRQIKLRGFRIELGEIERAIETHASVRQAVAEVKEIASTRRVIGYVVARDGAVLDLDELRGFLAARLPDYMIPSAFVPLARLPLLPSGKIDRLALPAPPDVRHDTDDAPRGIVQEKLATIWRDVLGVASIGIRDNFFASGGDSILALQVVARARKVGLVLSPAQMFLHQTIDALAAVAAEGATPSRHTRADDESGSVPLTPVQHWFFELPLFERHHWNQATLLRAPADLNREALEAAVADLVMRHDALRLRFVRQNDAWRQEYGEPGNAFATIDLSGEPMPSAALERECDRAQQSLDLGAAPLLQVVWFDYGAQPGRVLIVAHHLVIDGVSWRVLLDDLQDSYTRHATSATVERSKAPETSFASWARALDALAASGTLDSDVEFWRAQLEPPAAPLPIDGDAGDANIERDARHIDVELSESTTTALLHDAPSTAHASVLDLLLAAAVDALAAWTGARVLSLELEGHGRDAFDLDVPDTIGWFTALFPLRLDTRHTTTSGDRLRAVRDQLRAVPRKGAGFGLLRYSSSNGVIRRVLAAAAPQVSFNYLGQWTASSDRGRSGFGPAPESAGRMRSPQAPRTHLLEIVAGVVDRRLRIRWTYGDRLHARDTIDAVATSYLRALEALVSDCLATGRGSYTPSDFTAADLDQSELDKLLSKLRGS